MLPAEIAIVGAGPLGLATALILQRLGIPCRIFDARTADAAQDDARVLALAHGSRQILSSLGVWPETGVTPIHSIHVSQQGGFSQTTMLAEEQGVPALGYVQPARELIRALQGRVAELAIPVEYATPVEAGNTTTGTASLRLGGVAARTCTTPLVIWCEGSVRSGSGTVQHDYHQHALLCRARLGKAHGFRACERFTEDGPLALLPLGQDYAVVWTQPSARLASWQSASNEAWRDALQQRLGALARIEAVSDRACYPLALRLRLKPAGDRTVWLGNAAQTLHPVAGQGLNLALRDACELGEILQDAKDPGEPAQLARYARGRSVDRFAAAGFSDLLIRSFGSRLPGLATARDLGLLALETLPPLRRFLARRMIFGARAWP